MKTSYLFVYVGALQSSNKRGRAESASNLVILFVDELISTYINVFRQ